MDDEISGAQETGEGYDYYLLTKTLMLEGGFSLRKWATNDHELQERIEENEKFLGEPKIEDASKIKSVLGVKWNTLTDELEFSLSNIDVDISDNEKITKRYVLKVISMIFDPVGILGPFVINMKLLLQELCFMKCTWDEELNNEFCEKWKKLVQKLKGLGTICLPRFYMRSVDDVIDIQLHAFSDASIKAYAAVIYMRFTTRDNRVETRFVAAKTKVAPLKERNVPRLELLGCLLLSKLINVVRESLKNIPVNKLVCWTDNTDSMYWINGTDKVWECWVQNRVKKIRSNLSGQKWMHCPGKQNPADIPSRGIDISEMQHREFWLRGPTFLSKEDPIPDTSDFEDSPNTVMVVPQQLALVVKYDEKGGIGDVIDATRFSQLKRLLRVTSYVLRFIKNCKQENVKKDDIDLDDIEESMGLWIKHEQNSILNNEQYFNKLKCSLGAYLDEDGVVRLKGRLENSDVATPFPILLPKNNYFTELVILDSHKSVLHSGMKDTLNELRRKYWVTQGRSIVRSLVSRCLLCRKLSSKPFASVPTAPLPDFRVTSSYSFANTGCDYLGPLYVYPSPGSDKLTRHKVHVVLFTCASTRAVHLDLVPDNGSAAFTACLRRFISRRGVPMLMISDNAKCFIGPQVKTFLREKSVAWRFILEKSAWMGGFYERIVQVIKRILRKILGKSVLSYDELLTVITDAESVINSRPLCYLYSDEVDDVLTPSHLMYGRRLSNQRQTELSEEETSDSLNKRLTHLQKLMRHFRQRWRHEYLTELREHHRGNNVVPRKQVKMGDIVLVEDKKMPRVRWRLGLVTELLTSKDGFVRGCKLRIQDKTKNGYIFINRPVNQLCHFEVNSNDQVVPNENTELSKSSTFSSKPDVKTTKLNPDSDSHSTLKSKPDASSSNSSSISSSSRSRTRRNAAIVGELKRQLCN